MNKIEIGILKAYHEALDFINNACNQNHDQKLIAKARQMEYYDLGRHVNLNLPTFIDLNRLGCNY